MIDVTACPNCGDSSYHNKIGDRDWYECASCSLLYRSPRMTQAEIDRYYGGREYHDTRGISSIMQDACEHRRAKKIVEYLPVGANTILDIGCARGYLLEFARSRGYKILGVEPNEDWPFGGTPFVTSLDDVEGRFDVITCIHTLEHVIDFKGMIERIKELLAPKGMVILEVPNTNSTGVYVDAHLYVFKPSILRRLFEPLRNDLLKFVPHTFMTFRRET